MNKLVLENLNKNFMLNYESEGQDVLQSLRFKIPLLL